MGHKLDGCWHLKKFEDKMSSVEINARQAFRLIVEGSLSNIKSKN